MNFEMAADMAADEGIEVEKVVVNDDVAVENSTWTTGRRGIEEQSLYINVQVHEKGGSLAEVKSSSRKKLLQMYVPWEWQLLLVLYRQRKTKF